MELIKILVTIPAIHYTAYCVLLFVVYLITIGIDPNKYLGSELARVASEKEWTDAKALRIFFLCLALCFVLADMCLTYNGVDTFGSFGK